MMRPLIVLAADVDSCRPRSTSCPVAEVKHTPSPTTTNNGTPRRRVGGLRPSDPGIQSVPPPIPGARKLSTNPKKLDEASRRKSKALIPNRPKAARPQECSFPSATLASAFHSFTAAFRVRTPSLTLVAPRCTRLPSNRWPASGTTRSRREKPPRSPRPRTTPKSFFDVALCGKS